MNALIILLVAIAVLGVRLRLLRRLARQAVGHRPQPPDAGPRVRGRQGLRARRRPTWCSATISRPSPAPAPSTAPSRRPSSAGCRCFCGCSSAASSSAPCTTSARCSPPFATRGRRIATVIAENIDDTAKKLFCIFAYLTLILVVAAFASIVASTFAVAPVPTDDAAKAVAVETGNLANMRTAMISVLFIVVAVIYGVHHPWSQDPRGREHRLSSGHHRGRRGPRLQLAGHRAGQHHLDDPCGPVHPRGLRRPGVDPAAAARLPVELSALRHDRPGACRHHRRRRHGQRRLAGHSRIHRLLRCGWRHPRRLPRAFCSRRCSSPSPAAPSPASTAWWPRAPPPSSSTARPRRSPSPTAACCSSAWWRSSRCARWPSCSPATWTAPTPRRPRSSPRASPRCSPACPGSPARSRSPTRCLILAVSVFCLTSLDTATRLGRYMFQELFMPHGMDAQATLPAGARCSSNPVGRHHHHRGARRGAGHDRLPARVAAVRRRQPAAGRAWRCWPCARGSATRAATTRCSMSPWCSCWW